MSRRIDRLRLKRFRGASTETTVTFDRAKPMAVLFGENGAGKSTILDAIDAVCNGSPGSLAERSSTNARDHLPSIGSERSHLEVEIQSCGDTWKAALSGKGLVVTGPEGRPRAHVLRRSQLLRLVEAQPAKRYEELSRFVDVRQVERCEQTLQDALRSANEQLQRQIGRRQDAQDSLQRLWCEEGQPDGDYITWATRKASADVSALGQRVERIECLLGLIDDVTRALAAVDEAEQDALSKREALRQAEGRIASLPGSDPAERLALVGLLREAQEYLTPPREPKDCPVCLSPVKIADLRVHIAERLAGMDSVAEVERAIAAARLGRDQAEALYARQDRAFVRAVLTLAARLGENAYQAVGVGSCVFDGLRALSAARSPVDEQVRESANDLRGEVARLDALLRPRLAEAQADLAQFNAIRGYVADVVNGDTRVAEAHALHGRLVRVADTVRRCRHEFTAGALGAVAGEWNRLYGLVHPEEPLGKIRLYLDPNRRASVLQDAVFAGHENVAPQAYFSDSHLDSLGFCLFLALAKAQEGSESILVLDDVFTSADAVHLSRVIDVLEAESPSFVQTIVATHYRPWRDRYRYARGPASNVQLLALRRWSLASGVRLDKAALATEDLERALASDPFDRQAVGSQAGILLEALLDSLALLFRCHLPRKDDNIYTLGELLDSVGKVAKTLTVSRALAPEGRSEVTRSSAELQRLVADVADLAFIRNIVGCHYNPHGAQVSDVDVRMFGERSLGLAEAFRCDACGCLPSRAGGGAFLCTCGSTLIARNVTPSLAMR